MKEQNKIWKNKIFKYNIKKNEDDKKEEHSKQNKKITEINKDKLKRIRPSRVSSRRIETLKHIHIKEK